MYEVNVEFERPSQELIERARDTWACMASVAAGRHQVMDQGIRALRREWRIAGPAFTVRSADPTHTLVGYAAAEFVKPGDVIVVDAGAKTDVACWGATMTWAAKGAGAAGIVIDGVALTGELLIDEEDLPIFCRGLSACYVPHEGPGWMNVPVICGRVIVNPGDIILGDEDGVVVIPKRRALEILDQTGQGRRDPYPPKNRAERPYAQRGFAEKLRRLEGVSWNESRE